MEDEMALCPVDTLKSVYRLRPNHLVIDFVMFLVVVGFITVIIFYNNSS
jgi:hypothetical protein